MTKRGGEASDHAVLTSHTITELIASEPRQRAAVMLAKSDFAVTLEHSPWNLIGPRVPCPLAVKGTFYTKCRVAQSSVHMAK